MRTLLLLLVACGAPQAPVAPEPAPVAVPAAPDPLEVATAAVAAPDRTDEDRALDDGRHPAETLAFFGVLPGMKVAEIGAGGGYTSELLARIVGPDGHVYGQNSAFILERFAEAPWSARLARPVMGNVTRLDRPFDDPFPPELAGTLDVVVDVLFYHDTVWQGVDRAAMNAAVFAALRPGGVYGIVDHSARPEDGITVTESLHRIDEAALTAEIEAAGFVLDAHADHLRNPDDTRDWSASPRTAAERRGTSDRFVLRFRKPG